VKARAVGCVIEPRTSTSSKSVGTAASAIVAEATAARASARRERLGILDSRLSGGILLPRAGATGATKA
jgi:hypothetical protein